MSPTWVVTTLTYSPVVSEGQDGALGAGQRDDACRTHEYAGALTLGTAQTQPAAETVGAAGEGVGAQQTSAEGQTSEAQSNL